jgi:TPR repeat protein
VRPWLLSIGSLTLLFSGLAVAASLLPEPWPRVLSALLCLGLLILLGLIAMASFVGTPLGLATLAESKFITWTARFAPDRGAFLYQLAGASPTLDRARDRLFLAAERGSVPAMRELGRDYLEGAMGSTARAAGLPWLQRAAEQGDVEAAYWLGEAYRWGMNTAGRPEEAHQNYLKAARGGYRPAALWLARAYAMGDGIAADEGQAAAWAQRAAALTGAEEPGSSLLTQMVEGPSRMDVLVADLGKAGGQLEDILWPQRWFRITVWTCTVLFLLLLGVVVLVTPLLVWLLFLAVLGLFAASLYLRLTGLSIRLTSRGTRKLEARAAAGEPAACYELGLWFEEGHADLPRDHGAAREWFRRAALSGHPEALVRLADLLSWGLGGPKDSSEARRLLEQAAAMGMPAAHARLGRLEPGLSPATIRPDEKEKLLDGAP